ncbi:MAG: SURF1 family protein [Pseudomonadota bacterium]|nr:SURF1 family protein [Pseudomonadota bacterium]
MKGKALVVAIAALAGALLTGRLGWWQLDRAAQKGTLVQAREQRGAMPPLGGADLARNAAAIPAQLHRSVRLQGRWLSAHTVYLENRQMLNQPGFYVVTPLALDTGGDVLVERGWIPRDLLDRTRIVAPPPPPGHVQVNGRVAARPERLYEFKGAAPGPIRQNLEIASFALETGLPLLPISVVQLDGPGYPPDGLLRQWPQPDDGLQTNYGYAFQWFAMCALIIGLYVWFQLIAPRRTAHAQPS